MDRNISKLASESALKDRLLKTIFERVEDYAIFSLDTEGMITSWAAGAERIKGYKKEEVIGHHFSMLYPEEGRRRHEPENHLADALKNGRYRGEGLRIKKNGDLFLADVFITPMYEDNVLVGYFKIVTDLTERNKIVQERDLSRSKAEQLEIENDLRDRFIYMLTHDLRNPLSAARLSAEMIMKNSCELTKHQELARKASYHIVRVDKMVTDLLDVSRIREGQPFPLELTECNLPTIVKNVIEDLTIIFGDRFELRSAEKIIGYWDFRNIVRVLENLATNGIKYGAPDGKVTFSLVPLEGRVLVKVHNYGSTISTEDQETLFDIFHRTVSARKGATKGWGLGLTLVRGLTEAHGGIVQVRSLPQEGTTFILDLPLDSRKN